MSQNQMFCYQCEQTFQGKGCTIAGVCGKSPEVANLQDLLVFTLRGVSQAKIEADKLDVKDETTSVLTCEALFAKLTNVNFDPDRIIEYIRKAAELRYQLSRKVEAAGGRVEQDGPINLVLEKTKEVLVAQGKLVGIKSNPSVNVDLHSLYLLLTYGLKGVAAYTYHAFDLGQKDQKVFGFIHEGLAAPLNKSLGVNDFVGLALKCGEINIRAMELLDAGNTEMFGHPVPTRVPLGAKKGKAILISGHDLGDLEEVLKQSVGKGITVYTHGEMLPTHGDPKLKAYPHFYGHYGTAWQNQMREFAEFPGAILMTTNCLQRPAPSYTGNVFTTGPVGYSGVLNIKGRDFSPVIKKALELPGFPADKEGKCGTGGFR